MIFSIAQGPRTQQQKAELTGTFLLLRNGSASSWRSARKKTPSYAWEPWLFRCFFHGRSCFKGWMVFFQNPRDATNKGFLDVWIWGMDCRFHLTMDCMDSCIQSTFLAVDSCSSQRTSRIQRKRSSWHATPRTCQKFTPCFHENKRITMTTAENQLSTGPVGTWNQ